MLISAFVALTLSPMISAYFIKPSHKDTNNSIIKFAHKIIHKITVGYEKSLSWSLERPLFVILSAVVVLILSICLYTNLEYDFLPDEDKGRFLCILIAPQGSTSEYTDRMVKKMEKIISSTPEVEGYFSAVALAREGPGDSSEGLSYVRLKEQRKRNLGDILLGDTGLGYRLYHEIEGAIVFPIVPQSIGDSFSQPFQLVLQNQDLKQLSKYANVLNDTLTETPFLENVRTAFQLDKPKLNVIIDRKRAASLGVSIEEITHTLQILFDGFDLSTVNISGKKYNIIAQLERKDRLTPSDIDRIYVQNTTGQLIQLSSVARYEMGGGPNSIDHFNRYRSATIKGSLLNVSLGTAIKNAEQLIKKDLPAGFHYEWAGEAKNLLDSKKDLFFVLALSVLIIFMVLASQFENLIDPFTVMLTVPLAAFGAFGSLWFLNLFGIPGMGINLFSQIGLVLLIGLVTKNGILLVDFANQQMAKGKNAHEAMVIAGLIRLRPILMTVAATIVGILPIVIGFGIGAAGRRPLGIVVVGGMITSTFLTLFVIPVTYVLLSHLRNKFSEKRIVDHKKTLLIIIILSVFSSGCSIGPKYKIPLVDMSNKWKSNLLLKEATPGDSLLKGDWWTIFNDSTLDNLEKQAIVYNQDLKIAFATLNQARASAGLSQAAYIPDFEINPGYTNLDTLQNKFFGRANNIEGFYSIPLDISYEIDLWGRVKKTVESAKDQAQANDAAFQSVLLTLTSDVARNYFILKELDKEVKILEEISKLTQTEMSLNKDRYKAGILKILDIKRQAQELRDIRSQIIDVTIKRIEIENALGVLCGQNPSNFKISIEPLKETLPIIPVGIPSELLERRPDIAEAERLMAAANAMIGATKASFYPKVTLLGSTGFASAKLNALLDSNKIFSSFGPDISWSILNLKANKSNLQIILAKYDQTVATYRQRILIAFNEVEDALINIHAGEEKWNLQEQTVSAEAEDAKTSKEGYHQGVVNYIEVLDAERSVLKAELKSSVIMNNRFLWTIQLIKTLGGGWVQKDKV